MAKFNRIFFIVILYFGTCKVATAQDFYKDYRNYLIGNGKNVTYKRKNLIDTTVKRLHLTMNRFEKENRKPFFTSDTLYIISFQGLETGDLSTIVWNKNGSCYYEYTYEIARSKRINQKFTIETNASDFLKSFNNEFRRSVELADTAGFRKYSNEHSVLDGEWVTPTRAIKTGKRWKFVTLSGNGSAIDYDFHPIKKVTTITLSAMVDSLIRNKLHFNIDSAKAAYNNHKSNSSPAFPVIVLNENIVDFSRLDSVNLYEVEAITMRSTGSQKDISLYGENSKYGVVIITTRNRKRKDSSY